MGSSHARRTKFQQLSQDNCTAPGVKNRNLCFALYFVSRFGPQAQINLGGN
jgi:hypothetical protein